MTRIETILKNKEDRDLVAGILSFAGFCPHNFNLNFPQVDYKTRTKDGCRGVKCVDCWTQEVWEDALIDSLVYFNRGKEKGG